jgi:PST family polysaccharide transporter
MTFARILRSSALMGGASAVTLLAALIRNKLIAILLGPAGLGVFGILNQYAGAVSQIFGLGAGSTVVRHIADSDEVHRLQRESEVRRFTWKISAIGAISASALAFPACYWAFGGPENLHLMAIAGIAVPFLVIAGAWSAVMQARRQIGDLAKVQVISAAIGIVLSAPLVWFFGAIGAATSIVVVAGLPSLVICIMRRTPANCGPTSDDGTRKLLRLGVAMLGMIAVTQLSLYATRVLIVICSGVEHAGYYQAALATAGSIPNFIFVAMGVDYFPRVAAARDEDEILRLTNEQIQAGIMMALPLFAGLILFGRQLLTLLYSAEFVPAEEVQAWMIWGVACRLVSWPIGYWLMAKASAKEIFAIEGSCAVMAPILALALLPQFGFSAVGIAYFLQAILYGALVLWFMHRKTGRFISSVSAVAAVVALMVLGAAQWLVLVGATTVARYALFIFVGVATLAAYYKVSMDKSND